MMDAFRLIGLAVAALVAIWLGFKVLGILFGIVSWVISTLVTLAIVALVVYVIYLVLR